MSEQQPVEDPTESQAAPETDEPHDSAESKDSSGNGGKDGSEGQSDGGSPAPAEPGSVGDDQLPEDLQPTEDNPLARHPRQTGDEDDKIGANSEGGDAENPSASMSYRSDDDGNSDDSDDSGQADAEEDDGSSTLENGGGGAG